MKVGHLAVFERHETAGRKRFSKSTTHLKPIWICFGKCEDTTVVAPAGTMHCVMLAAEQLPLASSRPSVPEWEMPLHIYNARPPTPQQAVTTQLQHEGNQQTHIHKFTRKPRSRVMNKDTL